MLAALQSDLPRARFALYGSCAEGLASGGSDVDVTGLGDGDLRSARNDLRSFTSCGAVLVAQTPVVHLLHEPTGLRVDLTWNNHVSLRKSEILCSYLSPLSAHVTRFAKRWASARRIYGKPQGFLSGYGLTNMVLFAEMCCEDAEDTALLASSFFDFYAFRFDWHEEAVALRLRTRAKAARGRMHVPTLSIEDPLEHAVDAALHMPPAHVARTRAEFRRAARLLRHGSFEDVLRPRP